MNASPREGEVHQTEHGARQQRDGVGLVEELDGDVLDLLLVDHSEMHPVVHIILAQGVRSAISGGGEGGHGWSSPLDSKREETRLNHKKIK